MSDKSYTSLRPKAYSIITDPDSPRVIEADYLQCCHCGCQWRIQPGSGKTRGHCMECAGPVCGPDCPAKGLPFDAYLESIERGLRPDQMPVSVAVNAMGGRTG